MGKPALKTFSKVKHFRAEEHKSQKSRIQQKVLNKHETTIKQTSSEESPTVKFVILHYPYVSLLVVVVVVVVIVIVVVAAARVVVVVIFVVVVAVAIVVVVLPP